MEEDPIMEYGKRFRREISYSDLAENYDRYKQMLRQYAKNIKDSSEARKDIVKNLGKKDPLELLAVACRCIYDMTGDTYFERHTREMIEKIKTEKKDGTTKKTEEG